MVVVNVDVQRMTLEVSDDDMLKNHANEEERVGPIIKR